MSRKGVCWRHGPWEGVSGCPECKKEPKLQAETLESATKLWTPDEEKVLTVLYEKVSFIEVKKLLATRTDKAIYKKAQRLKLTK